MSALAYKFLAWLNALGIAGALLSVFIENLGIPFPTEVAYLISRREINSGRHNYLTVLAILTMGHFLGALVAYRIGYADNSFIAKRLQKNDRFKEAQWKVSAWYKKYGSATVFATRLLGYVRPWSSFVAGFAKFPLIPFVIWTILGTVIFNIIALYMSGILIGVWNTYAAYRYLIIILLLVTFFALFIWQSIRKMLQK